MLHSSYKLLIRDPAGVIQAEIYNPRWVTFTQEINQTGSLEFGLPGDHPAIAVLQNRSIVELWRCNRDLGLDWACLGRGLFLAAQRDFPAKEFRATCPSPEWLLSTRVIAWPAGVADRTYFEGLPVATIARLLVEYNAGPAATAANGRLRDGVIPGLQVEAGPAEGDPFPWECSGDNLLAQLQKLARWSWQGFELDYLPEMAGWLFRWLVDGLGTDRSHSVCLRQDWGSLEELGYLCDRQSEKTAAIAAGAGSGAGRLYAICLIESNAVDNDLELFVDLPQVSDPTVLASLGEAALFEQYTAPRFDYRVIQHPSAYYGLHYFLGDRVRLLLQDQDWIVAIQGVTIRLDPEGREEIDVEVARSMPFIE